MDYDKIAGEVLQGIGGMKNIENVTHCATRLRFTLIDQAAADPGQLKKIEGVLGAFHGSGMTQIVIGNQVSEVYHAIVKQTEVNEMHELEKTNEVSQVKKCSPAESVQGYLSAVFTPIIPVLAGAGLLKAFTAVAVLLGMNKGSIMCEFMNCVGDAPLYFLPILLAVTSAAKLGTNQYMAAALAGALLHPEYCTLVTGIVSQKVSSILGISVSLTGYGRSIYPVLLMVFLLKYVDGFLDKVISGILRFFLKPFITLAVVSAVTFTVLGPIGILLEAGISCGFGYLEIHAGWLIPTVVGTFMPVMVASGSHYGLFPFMLQSLAVRGSETIFGPGGLVSNAAQGGAGLAVALRTKDSKLHSKALSGGFTALLGITEPVLFSVTTKHKRVMQCVMIGGCLGGFYAGMKGVRAYAYISPGVLGLPVYAGTDGWSNLIHSAEALVISLVVTFLLVYVWGYREQIELPPKEDAKGSH